jgi:hypothetical protein
MANATLSNTAKHNIKSANAAWRDTSQYITLLEGEEITLRFFPDDEDGIQVKQDTFKGNPAGWKTFYKVVDVNSSNTAMRIFKANRKSSTLINKELANNTIQRIKRVGSGTDTLYQPVPLRSK